ncbi:helix-turn-helix domain-containing protein [Roseobacter sp. A03A-229]
MPDFMRRRRLARFLNRSADRVGDLDPPERGWISTLRQALSMSAEDVAARKGVSRNAVYQAERSEKEGSISLKQMDRLARAMGGRFVYAIVPDKPVEAIKYDQALQKARLQSQSETGFDDMPTEEQQDWIEDYAAQLMQDMPPDFWSLPK